MDDLGLNSVGQYLNPLLDWLQSGFNQVNAAQGLAIALLAAVLMSKWLQLPMVTLLATIVHAVIDAAIPIIAGRSAVKLPPLVEPAYWQYLSALFAGYLIIVSVFFLAKRGVMGLVRRAVPVRTAAAPAAAPPPPSSGAGSPPAAKPAPVGGPAGKPR
jgi:hypothetical protein